MNNYKNPGIAAVLSFVFTGLGQIYNGDIKKGLWLMFISAISMVCLIVGAVITGYWFIDIGVYSFFTLIVGISLILVSIIVIIVAGIYNIFDAYNKAKSV